MTPARAVCLAALVLLAPVSLRAASDDRTALDRYVAAPDPSYHYEVVSSASAECA